MKCGGHKKSGFTLIELLVVMAIIAVLAALLLPAIRRPKQKAQQTACKGNLHQLGVGLQNFVGENHAYPSFIGPNNSENPGFWIAQLAGGAFGDSRPITNFITDGVWRCPSAPRMIPWPPIDGTVEFCSYGYNADGVAGHHTNALGLHGSFVPGATVMPGHPGFAPVPESGVVAPAEMMAIGDSIIGGLEFKRHDLNYLNRYGRAVARHQGRLNILFCDGHVEASTLNFLFENTSDAALVRWNRDHQPHRESLPATP